MLQYDQVFDMMNRHAVRAVLIGGLNFFLRYEPIATRDIDLFIDDAKLNLQHCERALAELNASWGRDDADWCQVSLKPAGWLGRQAVHCLLCDAGELDLFTKVPGLGDFASVYERAEDCRTRAGTAFKSLSRHDMLACQLALPESSRRVERVAYLRSLGDSDV